jgi:hypothetical protein
MPGPIRGVGCAHRLDTASDDSRGQAAPAAVQHRDAPGTGEGHRQTVGDEDEQG